MGRSRDIATILSKTEVDNTSNLVLLNTSSPAGVDSAQVQNIGLEHFSTLDSLPMTNLEAGQQAYVSGTNRLYMSNGSGWFNVALINATPNWDSGGEPDAEYDIVDSATPLLITAKATDSDNSDINLLNQSVATDSAQYMVNISNDSSVWTFTPKSADSIGIEVAAGNLTDSNGDFIYTFKWSDGINFVTKAVTITYNPAGGGGGVFNWGGDRGLSTFQGNNQIDYFDITTASDASDFGDFPYNLYYMSANISNGEKQLFTGGSGGGNVIFYVSSATLGNAADFGDMTRNNFGTANASNNTRGIIAGGGNPPNDVGQGWNGIEYVTIDPAAHAVNFGTLAQSREHGSGVSDGTYMGICGGQAPAGLNNIDRITIDTTGNATDFGDLTFARRYLGGHGISSKCTTAGGENNTGYGDHIEEFTLDTNQNATYYGDLTVQRQSHGVTGNKDYGVAVGGENPWAGSGTTYDVIDRWSMSSSGNATDHGDLDFARRYGCAVSGNAA